MKTITEYTLIFKENTELFNEYDGEYITENREETDFIFENKTEQIEKDFAMMQSLNIKHPYQAILNQLQNQQSA